MRIQLQAGSNPFEDHSRIMGDLIGELHSRSFHSSYAKRGWKPAVNLYEGPTSYLVCVDLAGMKSDQIDVRTKERRLLIRGDRPMPKNKDRPEEMSVHLMEIDSGCFLREVEMPGGVAEDEIDATYRDGLLWINLPKREE